ncbi:MAG: hypothetical protein ABIW49_10210, partial [Knoellia sp.]
VDVDNRKRAKGWSGRDPPGSSCGKESNLDTGLMRVWQELLVKVAQLQTFELVWIIHENQNGPIARQNCRREFPHARRRTFEDVYQMPTKVVREVRDF